MFVWVHRRLREEEGISLVEVLVSIVLMGLVLAALGSNLLGSMASARQNEGLTQATAVANQQLEDLRNATWASLTTGAVGVPVTLPALPTVNRGHRQYSVVRTATLEAPDYKRYSVRVNWTENGATRTLRLDGRRTRRSGESTTPTFVPNPFRVLVFNINPDPVLLDNTGKSLPGTFDPPQPANTAMLLEVELSEPAAPGSVVATWPIPSPTSTLTLTEVAGSGGKKWAGTVASGQTYEGGWMNFQVRATHATSSTTTATGNTSAYLQAPIQNAPCVGVPAGGLCLYYDNRDQRLYRGSPGPKHGSDPTLSGDRLCLNVSTTRLRNTNPFYLGLKGLGVDDTVVLRRTDVAGVEFPMAWTKVATNFWWATDVTSLSAGTFTAGTNSTWEIQWTRSYDNLTSKIPLTFYVQNADGQSPC